MGAVCRAEGIALRHAKPHGALYNQAAADPDLAYAVARAVAAASQDLVLEHKARIVREALVRRESAEDDDRRPGPLMRELTRLPSRMGYHLGRTD